MLFAFKSLWTLQREYQKKFRNITENPFENYKKLDFRDFIFVLFPKVGEAQNYFVFKKCYAPWNDTTETLETCVSNSFWCKPRQVSLVFVKLFACQPKIIVFGDLQILSSKKARKLSEKFPLSVQCSKKRIDLKESQTSHKNH